VVKCSDEAVDLEDWRRGRAESGARAVTDGDLDHYGGVYPDHCRQKVGNNPEVRSSNLTCHNLTKRNLTLSNLT
jgi:hypothetical protein